MRVKVLGSAAGGGFPQWNCACRNCSRLRRGAFNGRPRSQAQVSISSGGNWVLLNASPDIRLQIESAPELHPTGGPRHSPISSVILTSADLDQVLGLLLLREFQSFRIYATASIRRILTEHNSMFGVLGRELAQVCWHDVVPGRQLEIEPGIWIDPIATAHRYPEYVSPQMQAFLKPEEAVLGLLISAGNGGSRLAYLPALACVPDDWLDWLDGCEVLLFDGTFWTDDELSAVLRRDRSARQMGHIPVSGPDGSLETLARLKRPRKIFFHINNTNPMLDEDGPEYRAVRDAGWELAWDGMELEL